ncbi:MAG: hypothetical protein QM811_10775 [Pirellulales bacterium]
MTSRAAWGLGLLILGWGCLASFRSPEVYGQRAAAPQSGELSSHVVAVNERLQVLTVVDSAARQVCVYHLDTTSGLLTLKATRSIVYDLQLKEFNTANPLPSEIRTLLEQR